MVSRLLAKAPALSATAVSLFTFMAIAFADTADDNWTSFRQAVPAHLQTLALSEPDKTGLRTLIISEPPPDTLQKSQYVLRLRGIFGDHFRTAKILRKETGLHGWVEDIVVGIGGYAGGGNDTELRDDLALLAETLWGTSYKMAPFALPAPRSREVSPEVPDIAIRQSELRDWLLDGKVRLSPVSAPAAPPRALMELAAAGTMGAFLSNDQRGLTVLLIDRRQPFEANRVEFRKFALDTDLVVGAVSIGSDYLAFVGRERQASVTTVPPLRFETALLLVTSKRAELSQSYERTQIFAGQLQSGKFKGWDWAPIYLSPELVDTELGSVLNFTDQMLKSWSEGGIIKYLYFGYPVPAQFPFPHPIMDEVQHIEPKVDSILFNWNTTGAFSLVDYQPTTTKPKSATLAVLHSGSLPMVYRDEERPIFDQIFNPFEAKGYEYFRNLKEPLLARVTSYQVFFQATRDHPLSTNENVPSITVGIPRDVVAATGQLMQHAHDRLAKLDSEDIDTECKRLSSIGVADSEEDCQDAVEARTIALAIFAAAPDRVKQRIAAFVIDPKSMPQISEADHKRAVEAVKASLKGVTSDLDDPLAELSANLFLKRAILFDDVDADTRLRAFESYAADEAEDANSYIRTPRLVLSNSGSGLVGGHNLNGRTTHVISDASLPRGDATVTVRDGREVVVLNPADVDKAGEIARLYAKRSAAGVDRAALRQELHSVLAESLPARPMNAALVIERPNDGVRGLAFRAAVGRELGWSTVPPAVATLPRIVAVAKDLDLTVVISKQGNEFAIVCVICGSGQEARAVSHVAMRESVVDALAQAPPGLENRIFFDGFTTDEVEAFRLSMASGGGIGGPPPGMIGATAAPAPRWWKPGGPPERSTASGGGHNGGGGNLPPDGRGPIEAGDPDGGLLILKFAKDQQEAHRVSVHKNKGSGPPEREGWMLAKGETARKGDWRAARVETVANPGGKDRVTSVELVIPTRDAQPAFEGRLDVTWTGPAADTESRAVGQATRQQLTELSPTATTIREGIGSLIDRLKKLQIGGNHVADVRFLFQRGVYDIILTEEDILASPVRG